mgnify:CR=1 FL=1
MITHGLQLRAHATLGPRDWFPETSPHVSRASRSISMADRQSNASLLIRKPSDQQPPPRLRPSPSMIDNFNSKLLFGQTLESDLLTL